MYRYTGKVHICKPKTAEGGKKNTLPAGGRLNMHPKSRAPGKCIFQTQNSAFSFFLLLFDPSAVVLKPSICSSFVPTTDLTSTLLSIKKVCLIKSGSLLLLLLLLLLTSRWIDSVIGRRRTNKERKFVFHYIIATTSRSWLPIQRKKSALQYRASTFIFTGISSCLYESYTLLPSSLS